MLFDSGCVVCKAWPGPVCAACEHALQPAGRLVIEGLDVCRAAFELDERARSIIAAFKYRRQRRLARWLAGSVRTLVPDAADVITWIPATPERRHSRGFDQGEELARSLARITGIPARRLLVRGRADARQTGLNRQQRATGPQLSPCARAPAFVVVVDDVVTTGSSMRVGATTLWGAGADRVVAIAAAATPLHRNEAAIDLTNRSIIREWT